MGNLCWICGKSADSAEHRLKKADITRAYGRGPYTGPSAPVHVLGGNLHLIQGANSKFLKYSANLCQYCNNTYTQPFDRAYDNLIDWIMSNEELVLCRRFIDFEEIYGLEWLNSQFNLFKYFAKSFGCRLVDANTPVPIDITNLFESTSFCTNLCLSIAVNEEILDIRKKDRDGFIGKGNLIAWESPSSMGAPDSFSWTEHVSWFTVCYWYNHVAEGISDKTWVAGNKIVSLGSF